VCIDLPVAGFETQHGKTGGAGFGVDAAKNGSRDALATSGGADVHALDLGEAIEQCDAAAPAAAPSSVATKKRTCGGTMASSRSPWRF
jgi:hypothetical protein